MPYKRPPPAVGPLFVICDSCGYLTLETAPDHCKKPLEHRQVADGVHLENSVHLDTDALADAEYMRRLDALWENCRICGCKNCLGRHFDGRA